MTGSDADRRWLAASLPFVRDQMPAAPARALEIGCGPLGGFVPGLTAAGHDVVGVDPEAPEGAAYRRVEFEQFDVPHPVDAVVACTSLHHVADLDQVLDLVVDALSPGGVVVVIEWAHELFDEATARWCFDRLGVPDPENATPHHRHDDGNDGHHHQGEGGWLHHHRDAWQSSGQSWEDHFTAWIGDEGLHTGEAIQQALEARFERRLLTRTPYFFPELDQVSEQAEQAAIDAGTIRPAGVRYVGRRR